MAKQLVINPFTEEMLSSMQSMLDDVNQKLVDSLPDTSSEVEYGNQDAPAPDLFWRVGPSDQTWNLQKLLDEWRITVHYMEDEVPDASMSFEIFKKFCEHISSIIDAKMNEFDGVVVNVPSPPLPSSAEDRA